MCRNKNGLLRWVGIGRGRATKGSGFIGSSIRRTGSGVESAREDKIQTIHTKTKEGFAELRRGLLNQRGDWFVELDSDHVALNRKQPTS